jgi:hypothetical protein
MRIETLGHASLCIRDDGAGPLLLTDPWLIGSCYWRSWWLQNYPTREALEELRTARYCYVTHTHPDHFHTASIRRLGTAPQYLCPELPQERIASFLRQQGKTAQVIKPFEWYRLSDQVSMLSMPLLNDDSALLIDTPTAIIVNLNDSKPSTGQLKKLDKFMGLHSGGKKRILLSSYSPASIVNSFLRGSQRVSIKEKKEYVSYICRNCRILKVDLFMPFASQVIFYRTDSAWANEYKVGHGDLMAHWSAPETALLYPYASVDLDTFETGFVKPEDYNHNPNIARQKALAQEAVDKAAEFSEKDIERLQTKMNRNRFLLALLFRKGIGFSTDRMELSWSPWSGKVTVGVAKGSFTLRIPTQALKDALEFGHFGDLGITMFTLIVLNEHTDPRMVYVFFMLNTLHDYHHTASVRNFFEWVVNSFRVRAWKIPAVSGQHRLAGSG